MPVDIMPAGACSNLGEAGLSRVNMNRLILNAEIQLMRGRIHEVQGEAADSFALACAASSETGSVIWLQPHQANNRLHPAGLSFFINPQRLILVQILSRAEGLWAMEQALRISAATLVVLEIETGPDLRESRRLQIAAQEGGQLGLTLISGQAHTSAAQTRWHCCARADKALPWHWQCNKNKAGTTGGWYVSLASMDKIEEKNMQKEIAAKGKGGKEKTRKKAKEKIAGQKIERRKNKQEAGFGTDMGDKNAPVIVTMAAPLAA